MIILFSVPKGFFEYTEDHLLTVGQKDNLNALLQCMSDNITTALKQEITLPTVFNEPIIRRIVISICLSKIRYFVTFTLLNL